MGPLGLQISSKIVPGKHHYDALQTNKLLCPKLAAASLYTHTLTHTPIVSQMRFPNTICNSITVSYVSHSLTTILRDVTKIKSNT